MCASQSAFGKKMNIYKLTSGGKLQWIVWKGSNFLITIFVVRNPGCYQHQNGNWTNAICIVSILFLFGYIARVAQGRGSEGMFVGGACPTARGPSEQLHYENRAIVVCGQMTNAILANKCSHKNRINFVTLRIFNYRVSLIALAATTKET